jgi:hypothetical protein
MKSLGSLGSLRLVTCCATQLTQLHYFASKEAKEAFRDFWE